MSVHILPEPWEKEWFIICLKTEIELQVTATKVVYTPGEFCQYADRYLRLTGISSQPEEHWEINSIKVNSIGIPDPDNAYAVKLKDKSAASQVELTPEGS